MSRRSVRKRLYFGKDVPVTREGHFNLKNNLSFSDVTDKKSPSLSKFTNNCQVTLSRISDALLFKHQIKSQAQIEHEQERKGSSSEKTNTIRESGPHSASSDISETELSCNTDPSYDPSVCWERALFKDTSQILFTNTNRPVKPSEEGLLQKENNITSDANILEHNGSSSEKTNNTGIGIRKSVPYSASSNISETGLSCNTDPRYDPSVCWEKALFKDTSQILFTNTNRPVKLSEEALLQKENIISADVNTLEHNDNQENNIASKSPQKPSNSNKKEFCIFCKDFKTNLVRHYKTVHQGEEEVEEFLQLEEGSMERSRIINRLKNKTCLDNISEEIKEVEGAEKNKSSKSKKVNYSKKREFCIFCEKIKTNIARHYELCHQDEEKVLEFLRLQKGSRERAELITKLRNEGNFKYNLENPEKLILVRRRHIYGNPENPKKYFLPCPSCKAFFSHRHLPKHYKICSKLPYQKGTIRCITRDARLLTINIHPIANYTLKYKIMPPMRNDEIFDIVKNDRLILLFGNYLTPKYIAHQEYIIRQRLRFLGRYLMIVKQECPEIKKLENLFHPQHFETAIKGVCQLGELSSTTGAFIKPKLALEMVQCLKIGSRILESTYIKEGKDRRRKNVNKFFKLLESESASRINKPAHRDLIASGRQNKIKKQGNLPLSDDITKFKYFLLERAENIYQNLSVGSFSYVLWRQLAELTLLYIVVYNRKRSGESHRILVEDFLNIHPLTNSAIPEELETLDKSDKKTAQITYKLVIRGKLDRTICAFIPQNVKLFLDYIYENRAKAKVPEDNPYLFGLPGKLSGRRHKTLETCFLMRKYTPMAKLRNPLNVRTTLLRKHLATKVSTLNLQDAQQETVHDFMGHHGNIHKGFYRQQVITKDLMMNKILDQDMGLETIPSTSSRNNLNGNRKLKMKRKIAESRENVKSKHLKATVESSVDSENETVYTRNLHIIQTTPIRPKRIRKKHSPKQRRIFRKSENTVTYPFEEPEDPYAASDSDDPSVKSIDLGDSSADEDEIENSYEPNNVRDLEEIIGKSGKPIQRQRWRTPQKKILLSLYKDYILRGIYPPGHKLQSTIDTYPELANRTVATIKSFLQHEMRKPSSSSNY